MKGVTETVARTRITIAEYLNYVDSTGLAIGHGKKVLQEAENLLKSYMEVDCFATPPYLPGDSKYCHVNLQQIEQEGMGGIELIKKKVANIREILSKAESKYIWFTNVDWVLFAFLAFYPTRKRIIVTVYRNVIEDMLIPGTSLPRLKHALVKRGLNKSSLVVATNPNLKISDRQVHLPDFYYDERYYKYDCILKKSIVTCLGAMRESKDLEGLIKWVENTDINLRIIGGFANESLFNAIMGMKPPNVIIENRRIPYEEYYQLIAESEFIVMPYKMEYYLQATSGILLETIFLNSIPIAPNQILLENEVYGIGYDTINELPITYQELHNRGLKIQNSKNKYKLEYVGKKLYSAIREL